MRSTAYAGTHRLRGGHPPETGHDTATRGHPGAPEEIAKRLSFPVGEKVLARRRLYFKVQTRRETKNTKTSSQLVADGAESRWQACCGDG